MTAPRKRYLSWATATMPDSKFKIHSQKMEEELNGILRDGGEPPEVPLYDYQAKAVLQTKAIILADEARYKAWKYDLSKEPFEAKPALIVAPTGAGKSGMMVFLPYVLASKKLLILTPSKVISQQIAYEFGREPGRECFFEKSGMVNRNDPDFNAALDSLLEEVNIIQGPGDIKTRLSNVVIVNAQKFGGNSRLSLVYNDQEIIKNVEEFFDKFDTLIVDEAHHYPAKTWMNIINSFGRPVEGMVKKIIFLTATPYKNINGQRKFILGSDKMDRVAFSIKPEEVVEKSTRRIEFREGVEDHDAEDVLRDILKIFKESKVREPRVKPQAMILVRLRTEATELAEELNELSGKSNFAVAVLGGAAVTLASSSQSQSTSEEYSPKRKRGRYSKSNKPKSEALEDFTAGRYRVAITCGVAREGYDNPNVVCCVILRKIVKGRIMFQQFVGRCRRIQRKLAGDKDQSVGVILSYPEFEQRKLWDQMEQLAEHDPIEVKEDEDNTED